MEARRFRLIWTDLALDQLAGLAERAPKKAAQVHDTLVRYAARGMHPGRATSVAGVYYLIARPLRPIGVFYKVVDDRDFRVVAIIDARRLSDPP